MVNKELKSNARNQNIRPSKLQPPNVYWCFEPKKRIDKINWFVCRFILFFVKQDHFEFPLFLQFYLFLLVIHFFRDQFIEIVGGYKGRAALLFHTTERKLAALNRG